MRRFWILFAFVAVACFYGFAQQALWSGAALKSPELRGENGKGQHRGLDIHYASYACS